MTDDDRSGDASDEKTDRGVARFREAAADLIGVRTIEGVTGLEDCDLDNVVLVRVDGVVHAFWDDDRGEARTAKLDPPPGGWRELVGRALLGGPVHDLFFGPAMSVPCVVSWRPDSDNPDLPRLTGLLPNGTGDAVLRLTPTDPGLIPMEIGFEWHEEVGRSVMFPMSSAVVLPGQTSTVVARVMPGILVPAATGRDSVRIIANRIIIPVDAGDWEIGEIRIDGVSRIAFKSGGIPGELFGPGVLDSVSLGEISEEVALEVTYRGVSLGGSVLHAVLVARRVERRARLSFMAESPVGWPGFG